MLQIPKLKELSFLVYGLGLSGCSVVKFFKKKNIKNFKVWDDKHKRLFKNYRTKNIGNTLNEVDYIVLSPGISLIKNQVLKKYKKKIITDIDLFYLSQSKLKSIVVTGTNGKSTTCKLLAHLLKKNRVNCFLGGNIGTPILDIKNFKKKFAIIEASSFQLSHSQFIHPDYAFLINITNDHLDWHGNKRNYLNSKFKIFNLQTKKNIAIVNKKFLKFLKKKFSSKFIIPENKKYKTIKHRIKNDYLKLNINDENMGFVFTFSKLLRIKEKKFVNSMNSFKGLPHRFEIFLNKKNVTFINDSKATSFKATLPALQSLKNIYWILGGLPKKSDKINLSTCEHNISKCYLVGKNIRFFESQISGKLPFSVTSNLKNSIIKILKDCKKEKKNINKFVLLSPAAASFDQFINFETRGEKFKKLSKIYARKLI